MVKTLRGSVVVITGASSGIGKAAALAFARRGAFVVVAARNAEQVEELADACAALSGRSLGVPIDITNEDAVGLLARAAVACFGRIDVWVNNAGVALFGAFEETPSDVYTRAIQTDLFGYIYGARAVLPYFREQGRGVLINNASILGRVSRPYASSYVVAKFGVVGLSSALRQELVDCPDIHVCTVLPYSIDTPLYQHAGNWSLWTAEPISPVYRPQRVAAAMVDLALRPRREVAVGLMGRLGVLASRIAPGWTERAAAALVRRSLVPRIPAMPTPGNLFAPMSAWTSATGGWKALEEPLAYARTFARMLRGLPGTFLTRS